MEACEASHLKTSNRIRRRDALWLIASITAWILVIPIALILIYGFYFYRSATGFGIAVFRSIALTILTSGLSAIIIFIVFTPLAYELAGRAHRAMETISDIPASIPHPVVGIAFLIMDSPITPTGRFLNSIGLNLFDSIQGIVIALTFVATPIYVRSMQSVFAARNAFPDLYAESLVASRLRVLYRSALPAVKREAVYSSLTAMSRGMSEFGSIAILAYYVTQYPFSGVSNASVLIFQYYSFYGPQGAITASAVMIVFSLLLLFIARLFARNREASRGSVQ